MQIVISDTSAVFIPTLPQSFLPEYLECKKGLALIISTKRM